MAEYLAVSAQEVAVNGNVVFNEPGCSFLFCVGKGKRLVKRKEFEKFIEKTLEV